MVECRVKVAHINTEALSWIFFIGQGRYMRKKGIEFNAISSDGPFLKEFAATDEVIIHTVEISRTITPLKDLRSIFLLWRKLRQIRPEIVHAHTTKAGLLGMISAWLANVPIRIYHNHGIALLSATGIRRILLRLSDKISCFLAHEVIYVAPSVMKAALTEGLCVEKKAKAILSINGLDAIGRFNPAKLENDSRLKIRRNCKIPADALIVGFVGRIFRVKGIVELVAAWKVLSRDFDSLHLLIVGEFDTRDPIPPNVEDCLRRDPRVHLTGYKENMPAMYAAMDLLILPSFHEGLGYVLIEASAMELPVVGTRIPGILDAVIDGVTGTLIEPGNPEALVNAVATYLKDEPLRRKHGLAGREYVLRNFRQEVVWEEHYQRYQYLLQRKGFFIGEPNSTTPVQTTSSL
jgi:glycosyltransferase involved in cell wall biosynthesis